MSNLIDRDIIVKNLKKEIQKCSHRTLMFGDEVVDMLMNAPIVDAEPVRRGKWEDVERNEDTMLRKCSVCGDIQMHWDSYYPNYCPNCGARMNAENDGGDVGA